MGGSCGRNPYRTPTETHALLTRKTTRQPHWDRLEAEATVGAAGKGSSVQDICGVHSRVCADHADVVDLTEDGYTLSGICGPSYRALSTFIIASGPRCAENRFAPLIGRTLGRQRDVQVFATSPKFWDFANLDGI